MMRSKVVELIRELEKELGQEFRIEIVTHRVPSRKDALKLTRKLNKMGFTGFRHHKHNGTHWYKFGGIEGPVEVKIFYDA